MEKSVLLLKSGSGKLEYHSKEWKCGTRSRLSSILKGGSGWIKEIYLWMPGSSAVHEAFEVRLEFESAR